MKVKRIAFMFIPLMITLLSATLVMHVLEKKRLIQTERNDDLVAAPPVNWLTEIHTPQGTEISIEHKAFLSNRFLKEKPENTFRMFVTGASFAMGFPIVEQSQKKRFGGIAEWIRDELKYRYPQANIEIINVAAGGQNSFRVVEVVAELIRFNPDAIFVMTGNNEGFAPRYFINQELHRWVVYRALKRQLMPEVTLDRRPLKAMKVDHGAAEIEEHYLANIGKIVDLTQKHDIELLLAAMPINLRPGKENLPVQALEEKMKDRFLQTGSELEMKGDWSGAIEQYAQSEEVGIATYLIGSCYEKMKNFTKAKSYYLFSLEFIPGMRSRRSGNQKIRELSQLDRVHLVDLEAWAEALSPHGITGNNLYVDICHMHPVGYYMMAQEALRVIEGDQLIPLAFGPPLPKPPLNDLLTYYHYNPQPYQTILNE
ncbi:MAG TPA: hypothetical protein PK961_08420 [bacterium]|nr:hypothetical protein [bacterium]